ncbi:hypothetical protein GFC29_3133 [Anoxybacillus sp. B7M1]|uniref:DUF2577 family protein n=1 Tax=unclassified Anoxybacillus TaxID=2639704 RepID=UPI0005CDA59F|nr:MULTISPECIES: DUF2577 family protein [unclassified Anoxybacillus]ANB56129.1 hypothetical protein GFC28_2303 [Anoxybacillus sp. B2M1]ANB63558.1 hypothetical protein GFC29_3133 [Anoxybacillus sp. B7M1]
MMVQMIKKIALEAVQAESPLRFLEAIVVSAPPDFQIKLRDNNKLIIPEDLISIAERLTELGKELKIGDRVMVAAIQGGQSFFIIDRIAE